MARARESKRKSKRRNERWKRKEGREGIPERLDLEFRFPRFGSQSAF